ncbi:hypothetical protein M422DRAFT_66834 [Sphaerobolus stellatus SS14]|uniref:Isopenicillin N synthase-like Fe(2+) 2OG dioxygenase domain-containing protein n=1 Tax=Sphaerobolus stellatus (strain SS14) TaxID=990650 RepID=A0A0C9VH00_SPHS4|nr:hypothetical protein M422DRAFT_66834 [Sphaerobolus stellatus SS14]
MSGSAQCCHPASGTTLEVWNTPPETEVLVEGQYVSLQVIDISSFDVDAFDDVCQPQDFATAGSHDSALIQKAFHAFRTIGFLAIKGHGMDNEQLQHQLNLGKTLIDGASEPEKRELQANIEEGSWAGYKLKGYYNRPDGCYDNLQHCDFYPFTALESRLPMVAKPYINDIQRFIEHNHYVVLRKVLAIISLGLGLEKDTLWYLHHRKDVDDNSPLEKTLRDWKHSKDHLRYAIYDPPSEEDRVKRNGLWLPGHTDIGSVTFLYSQPVAGLQVRISDGEWRYLRHYPQHIIIGLGDSMEFITGGVLKAFPHRVKEPPEDQRHLRRLGIFYFVPFLSDVIMTPLDHPSLKSLGAKDPFQEYYALGGKPLTSEEYLVAKSKLVGTKRVKRERREPLNVLEDIHFRYNPS